MRGMDSSTHQPPYAELTPDCVLDALSSVGLSGDGRLLSLNSYENRVYQVWLDEGAPTAGLPVQGSSVVAKFYRPRRWSDAQIAEEHAFVSELAKLEIPVVAPFQLAAKSTIASFRGFRFAVYPRCGGRAPELEDPATLEWMGRFIGRIHRVGAVLPFAKRPALDLTSFGEEPRDWLLAHDFIPADIADAWKSVVALALDGIRRCFERAGDVQTLRLHGDCHAGNVLWNDAGPHFVDFDDARMGPAIQDLWMLLSGNRDDMQRQLRTLVNGYEDFQDFDDRELWLIEALRTLRLIHYSAWLARRWDDPAFPKAFPWFAEPRYWEEHYRALEDQLAAVMGPRLEL
jgi:Ser/Thr protein kinase RdoA (MazF antagonist)